MPSILHAKTGDLVRCRGVRQQGLWRLLDGGLKSVRAAPRSSGKRGVARLTRHFAYRTLHQALVGHTSELCHARRGPALPTRREGTNAGLFSRCSRSASTHAIACSSLAGTTGRACAVS